MRTTFKLKTITLSLLLVSLLSVTGCATKRIAPLNKEVKENNDEVNARLDQINAAKANQPLVDRAEGFWIPARKVRDNELQTAGHKATSRRISVNRDFRNIQDIAERVTLLMGLPVSVAPEAIPAGMTDNRTTQGNNPATPQGMPGTPGFSFMPTLPGTTGIPLSYDGPLSGFLDVVAARFGISWEWTGDGIRFYRFATRTFRIAALPGDISVQNTVSNTTGGSGGGSGSGSGNSASSEAQQKTQVDTRISIWEGLAESIRGMMTQPGVGNSTAIARIAVTPATGTITVTDTPEALARIEKFIEQQNIALTRQVIVNVRVLAVELNNSEQYGINWGLVYQSISKNAGIKFSNAFVDPGSATGSNLALNVLPSEEGAHPRPWGNTQALINALSGQGRVSQITSASLTTLNNQSAPLQVGRQTTYLASSTTTVTQGAGATTTLEPGMLTTGFSMTIVPNILDRGRLMLQYAIDISSLVNMYTVNSNNSSIQAPDVDTRNFLQRVMLHTGDTLVMTGFEQNTLSTTSTGMGSAKNPMFGGGVNGKRNRSVLVILVQPITAD